MMDTADLSIIIVNWNSAAYTAACIASIRRTVLDFPCEIIVVDNGSSDNSVDELRRISGIHLITNHDNVGFARANNCGYQYATGKVLLFLNPDTEVHDAAIATMQRTMLSSERMGIVGCQLLNADGSMQTSCVQSFPTILNQLADIEAVKMRLPWIRMWGIKPLFETGKEISPVEVISGACLMIRRSLFERLGLFSTDYFMYCEDVDLCYKAAAAGFQAGYVASARVTHYGGQSSKQAAQSSFATVMRQEAIYRFLVKTRGPGYARSYGWAMFGAATIRLVLMRICSLLGIGRDRVAISARQEKWRKTLNWSRGREGWATRLHALGCNSATPGNRTA